MNYALGSIFALLPGGMEWMWILLIVLLLFGGSKLPGLAKGLGQSIKEFKKAASTDDEPEKPAATETKKSEAAKTNGSN